MMRIAALGTLTGLLLATACGPDYADAGCTPGPGCYDDIIPPVGVIETPAEGDTVRGPFTVVVTATDNIGVGGVDYLMDGVKQNEARDIDAPYQFLLDPTLTGIIPGGTPGPRALMILVFDAAGNVDTLRRNVMFIPCGMAPAGASGVPCLQARRPTAGR